MLACHFERHARMFPKISSVLIRISAFTLFIAATAAIAQTAAFSPESEQRARDLLKQMTVEEKVGQITQSAGLVMPGLSSGKPDALIAQGKVGSVLWLIDVNEINRLQHIAIEESRLHIPM